VLTVLRVCSGLQYNCLLEIWRIKGVERLLVLSNTGFHTD
jgi:hypothetical protein